MKPKLFSLFCNIIVILALVTVSALAVDTISLNQTVLDGETIVSAGRAFELGFFGPSESKNERFVGLWSIKHPGGKILWVANRELPVTDSSGAVKIGSDGNLIVTDGKNSTVWSTNVTLASNNTVVVLSDNGNLVLRENKPNGLVFWESFNDPSDNLLPGMKIGLDQKTGNRLSLFSWKDEQDPRVGSFIALMDAQETPQIIIMNGSTKHWRTGQWTGTTFTGVASMANDYRTGFSLSVDNREQTLYFTFAPLVDFLFSQSVYLTPKGDIILWDWDNGTSQWFGATVAPLGPCDFYGTCGPFGNCTNEETPICKCLRGYEPKFNDEWSNGNWSSGCVRRTEFQCERNKSSDGLLMFPGMKLPDFSDYVIAFETSDCKSICLRNCSCLAVAYVAGLGCLLWGEDLIDLQKFPNGGEELYIRLASSELDFNTTSSEKEAGGKNISKFLAIPVVLVVIVLGFMMYILYKRRNKRRDKHAGILFADDIAHGGDSEVPFFTLQIIESATDKFSATNILGQGGFGPVYKGRLPNGQEIAVKRLSKSSGQGNEEFKNEAILFSKLQHRNLVKLLGLCIQEDEKMLVYEYMPNKSLDSFIFGGSTERATLDWSLRYNIIEGIARGLLYLHRDSRLKIIHRDLKASNILLDEHMNPKISDFGMARVFGGDQSEANTNRVVGTYGYMPPEYAMQGIFSEKSDVFSYGVLLLEIVSGIRNNGYHHNENSQNLLAYAWQLWNDEKPLELLDSNVENSYNPSQVNRCIHLALLCVQEHVNDRPTMSIVVSMLSNDTDLAFPDRPAFSSNVRPDQTNSSSLKNSTISENTITLTSIEGR